MKKYIASTILFLAVIIPIVANAVTQTTVPTGTAVNQLLITRAPFFDYTTIASTALPYVGFSYASSSFVTFGYASSTYASTSFITTNYVPYMGANADIDLGGSYGIGNIGSLNITGANPITSLGDLGFLPTSGSHIFFRDPDTTEYQYFDTSLLTGNHTVSFPDQDGIFAFTSDIPDVSNFVPYTGASTNVNLGSFGITSTNATTTNLVFSGLSNNFLSVNAQGKVIATTSPISSQWITNGTAIYYNTGNVGIGTSSPLSLFTVASTTAEIRLENDGGTYSRYTRASSTNAMAIKNQVSVLASMEATGGTITHSGGYTIHTFTASSTFDSTLSGTLTAEAIVVGGGGAGGGKTGGGGGAGGFISSSTITMSAGVYTITVGAGGTSPGSGWGNNGATSTINNITGLIASGGGGGGSNNGGEGNGKVGGSGGGGSGFTGSAGTAGQGNTGGTGLSSGSFATGGGGGSGSVGGNGSGSVAGNGGTGTASSISGASVTYACGGGGGTFTGTAGNGGCSSAGNGGSSPTAGTNGFGGGGGGMNANGGAGAVGGSGVVIIRYLTPVVSVKEADLITSVNSSVANEVGVNTFGTSTGATHLSGDALYFDIGSTNYMNIISSGKVGIGTSTPNTTLSVIGVSSATHFAGNGISPTVSTSTGDGTNGGTANLSSNSNDVSGLLTVTTGNAPALNAIIATITFNTAYTSAPACVLTNATSSNYLPWATTTTTSLKVESEAVLALTGTSTYAWYYHCFN